MVLLVRSPTPARELAVPEVAYTGEDHGHAQFVGGGDNFGVAHGASGLDDCGGSGVGDGLQTVGEWEEGVRGGYATGQGEDGLHGSEAGCVYARHPAGSYAYGL